MSSFLSRSSLIFYIYATCRYQKNNVPSKESDLSRFNMAGVSVVSLSRDRGEGQLLEAAALRVGDRFEIF